MGCYAHDLHRDTAFLLSAALISKAWSRPAQTLLFRHVSIRSQKTFKALFNVIYSDATLGKRLAQHVRSLSAVLDPQQPGRLHEVSFAYAVSLFPNLSELEITFYPTPKPCPSSEREGDFPSRSALEDKALSILRSGPCITSLRLANWSSDTSLLGKFLSLYHRTLRTLSLHGTPTSFYLPRSSPFFSAPLSPLDLTLEPSLAAAPALADWLANPGTGPPVRALEFTRQPEPAVLAAMLATHGASLTALALPTLTIADAARIAAHGCPRLEALRTEHPYATLPPRPLCARLRFVALAASPALALVREEARNRGRLQSISVILWCDGAEELETVRVLKALCAPLGIRAEFERDVVAFRARFRIGRLYDSDRVVC